MILEIEIQGVGRYKVKHDLLHRGHRPRLKTFDNGIHREVSFNSFVDYLKPTYQKGFDYKGNEIMIRVTDEI